MATINKQLAEKLVKDERKYKGDKRAYCVLMYQNRTKYGLAGVDLYDTEAPINCFDYAVFYNRASYLKFLEPETVGGVTVMWGSKTFHQEELKASKAEENREFTEFALSTLGVEGDETIDDWLARSSPEGTNLASSRWRK